MPRGSRVLHQNCPSSKSPAPAYIARKPHSPLTGCDRIVRSTTRRQAGSRGFMSSENIPLTPAGRPLTAGAIGLMLMLCLSWAFNQIAVKLALPDIPPFLQASIRSCGAIVVLLLIAWIRGVKLFARDGTLGAGLFAG